MKLVHKETGNPAHKGDLVKTFRGEECRLVEAIKPHKPGSTGRVIVMYLGECGSEREFYPSVCGLEWREA